MSRKIKVEDVDLDYDVRPVRLPMAHRKTDVQPRARIVEAVPDDEEDLESDLTDLLSNTEGTESSESDIDILNQDYSNCVYDSSEIGGELTSEEATEPTYDQDSEVSSRDADSEDSDDDFEPGEQNTGASFEDLPPEIRNKIYHLALVDEEPILAVYHPTKSNKCNLYSAAGGIRNHASIRSLGPRMRGFPVQLLGTNKAISIEAAKVFYGSNTLVFWIGKAPVNYMDFFFGPTQCPHTKELLPRSTLSYMRNIKLIELADHDSIKKITQYFKEAAKAARKAGEPMALKKLYVRKLQWKQDQIVAELVPMLRALRKCQPKESLESSGVLELVEFISWDKGASALQIRQANDRNKLIRKALKVYLQAME